MPRGATRPKARTGPAAGTAVPVGRPAEPDEPGSFTWLEPGWNEVNLGFHVARASEPRGSFGSGRSGAYRLRCWRYQRYRSPLPWRGWQAPNGSLGVFMRPFEIARTGPTSHWPEPAVRPAGPAPGRTPPAWAGRSRPPASRRRMRWLALPDGADRACSAGPASPPAAATATGRRRASAPRP